MFDRIVSFVSLEELFHIISNSTPNPINGSSLFDSIELVIDFSMSSMSSSLNIFSNVYIFHIITIINMVIIRDVILVI